MTRAIRLSVAAGCAACLATPAIAGSPERAYQRELLADADSHASLLSAYGSTTAALTWGADRDGYAFGIDDGASQLLLGGVERFGFVWNSRDGDTAPGANDETSIGFRNFETSIDGYAQIAEGTAFNFTIGTDASGMIELGRAYIIHQYDENGSVIAGQFHDAFTHEGMVEAENQLGITGGIFNAYFDTGYTQGIGYQRVMNDRWRLFLSFNDGHDAASTDITMEEVDWGFTGRVEYLVGEGTDFDRFNRYSSESGSDYATLVGTALHLQDGGETNGSDDIFSLWWVVDATAQGDGWNAGAAFAMLHWDDSAATDSTLDMGLRVFGGMFLTDSTEAFAAWDSVIPDNDTALDETLNALNFGIHYYPIDGNRTTRFSADVLIYMGQQSISVVDSSTELALLSSGEDTQFSFRAFAQLVY